MTRAAIYVRLSKASETSNSIDTQLTNLRALRDKNKWEDAGEFIDYGISGYSGGKRPQFQKLLLAIDQGKVDVVMARDYDRLTRNKDDESSLNIASIQKNVKWQIGTAELTDPSTAMGGLIATVLAAIARFESDLKRERLKAHYAGQRADGTYLPARVPFGYQEDKVTPHPTQGPAVQWAYKTIAEGGTLYAIKKAWNTPGATFQPPNGTAKEWGNTSLRHLLERPYNAGMVQYLDELVPDVQGPQEPLVTVELWNAVQDILSDPQRRTSPGPKQRHLMGGLAICGLCGGTLRSASKKDKNVVRRVYRCLSSDKSQGPHPSITTAVLDELVVEQVVSALLFGADALPADSEVDLAPLESALSDVRGRRHKVVSLVSKGLVKDAEAEVHLAALNVEEEAAVAALVDARSSVAGSSLSVPIREWLAKDRPSFEEAGALKTAIKKDYLELPIEQQRELMKALVDVTVNRGRDDSRVIIEHKKAVALNEDDPSNLVY
jgi:site-specific DNA recombinase